MKCDNLLKILENIKINGKKFQSPKDGYIDDLKTFGWVSAVIMASGKQYFLHKEKDIPKNIDLTGIGFIPEN